MADAFLTPSLVWGSFYFEKDPKAEIVSESIENGIEIKRLYIEGRRTATGNVQIYAITACKSGDKNVPPLYIMPPLNRPFSEETAILYANKGYNVMMVDLAGEDGTDGNYTKYPIDVDYANYCRAKDDLYKVENDITGTPWYEWASASKYALKYFKNATAKKVSLLGMGTSANVMWQTASFDKDLACAVFVSGTGWQTYKGYYKFSNTKEPQFTDEQLKFIAGLEAQNYAKSVYCPCLALIATNGSDCDCDRANDTVSRISASYHAIDYSVGSTGAVYSSSYSSLEVFLKKYSFLEKKGLPKETEIETEVINGVLTVNVMPDINDLSEIILYCAEDSFNPEYRVWNPVPVTKKGNKFVGEYKPYYKSKAVFFFAKAKYKSGFNISSYIICKKIDKAVNYTENKDNLIYSSRNKNSQSTFGVEYNGEVFFADIEIKKGSMNIEGASSKNGIITFNPSSPRCKPNDYSILMFDVYVEKNSFINVGLEVEDTEGKVLYSAKVDLLGGKVWHNVKLELNRFKTQEGKPLKTYEKVTVLKFSNEEDFIINNVLWI